VAPFLAKRAPVIELGLSYAVSRIGIPAKSSLQAWLQAAFAAAKRLNFAAGVGMSLRFVDLDEGRALNLQYRKRDYATNVLSFPAELPVGSAKAFKQDWLGDLIVCAPVIASEARAQHKAARDHYAHMCVHGMLHLLGMDHIQAGEAKRMEHLEVKILAHFCIANPYLMRTDSQ
jgi:probable rRNA maturation factor